MQSRVIASSSIPTKLNTLFFSNYHLYSRLLSSSSPDIHSTDDDHSGPFVAVHPADQFKWHSPEPDHKTQNNPIKPPKSPIASSPQLQTTPINQPTPNTQQKRSNRAGPNKVQTDDLNCADIGWWPEESGEKHNLRKEQEVDNKEYFSHHKASPLSEIEMAETRKPVSQVSDGTAGGDSIGYDSAGVITFKEEQLISAEETMKRATEMFRAAAARGDPDSPHGRILRTLRGENW